MHHVVLDEWSRRSSALHRFDPRAKFIVLVVFLVVVATTQRALASLSAALLLLLLACFAIAQIPLAAALRRAALVLPFIAAFAAACWFAGDPDRALALALKSYLSALAVLLLMATTPLPQLLAGLESLLLPRFLLTVAQFLYRYLFVISEEAQHMRIASLARAPRRRGSGMRRGLKEAGGALAVLFARSHARAEEIHRAMLARGFAGHFQTLTRRRFTGLDALVVATASLAVILLRLGAEGLAK